MTFLQYLHLMFEVPCVNHKSGVIYVQKSVKDTVSKDVTSRKFAFQDFALSVL